MEFNYRYVNSKSPLYFSMVNVGNMREFLLELSANARMLWDYSNYDTEATRAKQYMYEAQHGIFSTWYSDADPLTRTFQIDSLLRRISRVREQAPDWGHDMNRSLARQIL